MRVFLSIAFIQEALRASILWCMAISLKSKSSMTSAARVIYLHHVSIVSNPASDRMRRKLPIGSASG